MWGISQAALFKVIASHCRLHETRHAQTARHQGLLFTRPAGAGAALGARRRLPQQAPTMLKALAERERGALAWADGPAAAAASHRPHRFQGAALGDAGLTRRLCQTAALAGHSGGISALAWGEGGDLLASGGEDCRLRLWRSATGELLHSLDTVRLRQQACWLA